jgi:hypothetical protein
VTGSEAGTPLVWGLRHGGRAAAGGDDAGGVDGVELDEQPPQHRAGAARLLPGLDQVAVQDGEVPLAARTAADRRRQHQVDQ